jgi:hypothetical protein
MSRTEALLREQPGLFVSLPRNELELAEAALEGGADGLKVHLNVHHHASGTHFGSWAEEQATIREILALGVPVGMVPGVRERTITPREALEIEAAGVDFIDAYIQDMPMMVLESLTSLAVMAALGWQDETTSWSLGPLEGRCALLEASVVHPDGYGQPLAPHDLAAYGQIAERYPDLPAIVPTQRELGPAEVERVVATGMRGILIGAIVTGKTAEGIRRVTGEFRQVL